MKISRFLAFLAILAFCKILFSAAPAYVGGGFTQAGISGDYYPGTALDDSGSVAPLFNRQDVRIDFDWGDDLHEVGGTHAPGFRDIGRDSYSIRWTGQIIPRFSETYTFIVEVDDGAHLYLKAASSETWTEVISAWSQSGTHTGNFTLTGGERYDLRLEYREMSGDAKVRLLWSSPSTPEEVINPLHNYGYNCYENLTNIQPTWTDLMKSARPFWEDVATDDDGWPLGDGHIVIFEGLKPWDNAGDVYQIQFTGQATVSFTSSTVSTTYDAGTNTTTGTITVSAVGEPTASLTIANSRRTPASPLGSGVTDIKILREIPGQTGTYYDPGEHFNRGLIDHCRRFAFLRVNLNNANHTREWSQRTLPTDASQWGPLTLSEFEPSWAATRDGICWEYRVQWANQAGKDLYINIPHAATGRTPADTESYIYKLAQLLKYGSDGVEPYTTYQSNPAYPPLNPNLKVYIEYSNEVPWNTFYSFSQSYYIPERVKQMFQTSHPDTDILNYESDPVFDGTGELLDPWKWSNRYVVLRTVQIGDIFRSVWGQDAWQKRLLSVLHTQYGNNNLTATLKFNFLEDYYNNADGISHVANPRPANYYVHVSGGAFYFGPEVADGLIDTLDSSNSGLESPVQSAPLVATPTAPDWTFSGDAGIARRVARTPAIISATPGGQASPANQWVGFRFTVGGEAMTVYELGRWNQSGSDGSHQIHLIRQSDGATLLSQTVNLEDAPAGSYAYAPPTIDPVTLPAGTSYYLLCQEASSGDAYYDGSTLVTPQSGIVIEGTAVAPDNSGNPGTITTGGTANRAYGPVNLGFALASADGLPNPDPREGDQMLYLGSGGRADFTVIFPAEQSEQNAFALSFLVKRRYTSSGGTDWQGVRVLLDGQDVTGNDVPLWDQGVPAPGITPGSGWATSDDFTFRHYTAGFFVSAGSTHTLTLLAGVGDAGRYVFVDDLILASSDQMFGSGNVGEGSATGLVNTASSMYDHIANQAMWSHCYGFELGSYEGMFNIGGDFGQNHFGTWVKFEAPQMYDLHRVVLDTLSQVGMSYPCHGTYNMTPEGLAAQLNNDSWMIPAAIDDALEVLPPEPTWGTALPARLTPAEYTNARMSGTDGVLDDHGAWLFWSTLAPITDTYNVQATVSGTGNYVLESDGLVVATGTAGTPLSTSVLLTAGQHGIRLRSLSGNALTVEDVVISSTTIPWAPSFSPEAGNYLDPVSVTLSSETAGVDIWYTTNGDEPVEDGPTSQQYTGPVAISQDTTLKARATASGMLASTVSTAQYTFHSNYEGFDGEAEGWSATGNYTSAPGLSYGNLPTSEGAGTSLSLDVAGWQTPSLNSGVVWLSYLFNTSVINPGGASIRLKDGSTIRFGLGFEHWYSNPDQVGIWRWSNSTFVSTGVNVVADETCLVAVKLDFDQQRIDLWLNPTLDSEPTGDGDATISGLSVNEMTFDTINLGTGQVGDNTARMDEVRLGRTWAQVTGAVSSGPVITTHPANTTVKEGDDVTMSVGAEGTGLTYQWEWSPVGSGAWSAISGANSSNFTIINVTPSDEKDYRVVITDSSTATITSDVATLTVDRVPTITTTALPDAVVGLAYSEALNATSGTGTLTWSLTGGSLPAGLSLSSAGIISGTPTVSGSSSLTLNVSDSNSDTDSASFNLSVFESLPTGFAYFDAFDGNAENWDSHSIGTGTLTTGLSYPGLNTSGSSLTTAHLDAGGWDFPLIDSGVVWISYLFETDQVNEGGAAIRLLNNDTIRFGLGFEHWYSNPDQIGVLRWSNLQFTTSGIAPATATPYLVVTRIDIDNGTLDQWIDPSIYTEPVPPGDVSSTGITPAELVFDSLRLGTGPAADATARLDEIRIAFDWESVLLREAIPDPFAYDGFDGNHYGWTTRNLGFADITMPGLSYGNLLTSEGAGTSLSLDASEWQIPSQSSGVVWLSYLFNTSAINPGGAAIRLKDGSTIRFGLGFEHWYSNPDQVGIWRWSNSTFVSTGVNVAADETCLVAVKLDFDQQRIDLWLNPTLDSEPTGDGDATISGLSVNEMTFDTINLGTGQAGDNTARLDEVRIGNNWEEITPLE